MVFTQEVRKKPVIVFKEKQKDLTFYEGKDFIFIVYGYPYSKNEKSFLKANNIYSLHAKQGANFLDKIDGCFAILSVNKVTNVTKIYVDPFKIYTFYIKKKDNKIVISNSLREVCQEYYDYSFNDLGILEFLNFGFVLGDKTIFKDVYTLEGGFITEINYLLKIKQTNYINYNIEKEAGASKEDFLKEFTSNLETASHLGRVLSLPLTGGLDSRTILSVCLNIKEKLHCYTHGLPESLDVKIARKISKICKLKYSHYELDEKFISNIPKIAVRLSENFEGMLNSVLLAHLDYSCSKESNISDTFLTGIGGEFYRYYYIPGDYKFSSLDNLAADIRQKVMKTFFNIFDQENIEEALTGSVLHELEKYNSYDPNYLSSMFYLKNRIANFAAPSVRLIGKRLNIFNPYLSKKLLYTGLCINNNDKIEGVQKYTIMKNSRILTDLPMDSGRVVKASLKNRISADAIYAPVLFKKAANRVLKRKIFNDSFTNYFDWVRNDHQFFIMKSLDHKSLKIKSIISEEKLKKSINLFFKEKQDITYQITNLVSLQLYLDSTLGAQLK